MVYQCGRFKTGDRGQRYEITYFDPDAKRRRVFGWAANQTGADAMCDSINLHPTMRDPKVRDRNCPHEGEVVV